MKTVRVNKAFPYSPNGIEVIDYETGDQQLPDEVADLAIAQGWAAKLGEEDVAPKAFNTDAPDVEVEVDAGSNLTDALSDSGPHHDETAAVDTAPDAAPGETAPADAPKTGELGL